MENLFEELAFFDLRIPHLGFRLQIPDLGLPDLVDIIICVIVPTLFLALTALPLSSLVS